MNLSGKVFAITGASRGIGADLAIALCQAGAKVALGARNLTHLHQVQEKCFNQGAEAIAIPLDVSQKEQCQIFIEQTIQAYGRLDGLINNAGITLIAKFEDITDLSSLEQVMQVNYLGAVYCTHFALPYLKQTQGLIVAISSLCGKTGIPTRCGYVASKHAMQGFFDTLRIELSADGVDVLVVSPGFVATDIRQYALNGQGSVLGQSNRNETQNTMSLSDCTQKIMRGIHRRQREVVMTPKGKLIPWGKLLAPKLLDRLSAKATRS